MDDEDFDDSIEVARNKVDDVLSALMNVLGPELSVEGTNSVFLSGWVTVIAWTDENGQSYSTAVNSKNLPSYTRNGLLHNMLYETTVTMVDDD